MTTDGVTADGFTVVVDVDDVDEAEGVCMVAESVMVVVVVLGGVGGGGDGGAATRGPPLPSIAPAAQRGGYSLKRASSPGT